MDRSYDLEESTFQFVEGNQMDKSYLVENPLPSETGALGASIYLADATNNDTMPDGLL